MLKQYLNTQYDIDEKGNCFSHISNKFLKPQMTTKYPSYNLTIDGKRKKVKVHRMVAETFLPKIDGKNIVNHKDGNTHNYCLENLEWCTSQENSLHAINTGLTKIGDQTINKYIANLPNEEWLPVLNYPNYVISNCGRIMNIRTKRLLKQCISNSGYYEVNLWKSNKGKTTQVHRIVYSTFMNDYELKDYIINHKDGNKLNNNLNNLEKITYQENNLHAAYIIKTHNSEQKVYQLDDDKNIIAEFASMAEAKRKLGIDNISRAAKNGTKAGGFYWKKA